MWFREFIKLGMVNKVNKTNDNITNSENNNRNNSYGSQSHLITNISYIIIK